MSEHCYICGEARQNSLEEHHLVPKRYGGSDSQKNLATLCASCHSAIEKLYDDAFFKRMGVSKPSKSTDQCGWRCMHENCTSTDTSTIKCINCGFEMVLCNAHKKCTVCGDNKIDAVPVKNPEEQDGPHQHTPRCKQHRICTQNGCASYDTSVLDVDDPIWGGRTLCDIHRIEKEPSVTSND